MCVLCGDSQLMLMKEDIEQLMGAIPTLQDGQVEDASKFAKLEVN